MNELSSIIESILFACGEPVPIARLSLVLERDEEDIISAFEELDEEYNSNGHSLCVLKLGDKLQICSSPKYSSYVSKVMETRKPPALSNPALETLAIVAYFQPTTLAYISKIRGVDSTYTVSSLTDKGLIEEKGRLDAPGRPILYCTTDAFLRTMNISSLDELPVLPDLSSNTALDEMKAKIDVLQLSSTNSEENVTEEEKEY